MSENSRYKVKNKAVAELQISAEQILLEAYERKEQPLVIPEQKITDLEEVCIFLFTIIHYLYQLTKCIKL